MNLCAGANEAEKCRTPTAHINDSRHDGFRIIMQISHVVRQGANIQMVPIFPKIGSPKWSSICTKITFGSQVME